MKKNIKGFSLVIAMGLVIVISLLAFTILEYIIPFSKDIKGIENSSKAYYQANSGIEEGLYKVFERNYSGGLDDDRNEFYDGFSGLISNSYATYSTGNTLPPAGEGNSEVDNNWNTISSGNPIQLSIGSNYLPNFSGFEIAFRVPNIDLNTTTNETLSGTTLAIVNWQLSSIEDTLNSSGEIIKADDVLTSNNTFINNSVDIDNNKIGSNLNGDDVTLNNFYDLNCEGSSSGCILKFSIVNKLETTDGKILPYLEWKIVLDPTKKIPLSHTKLNSSGKSYGFKKDISIKIPAPSVNEAFDFTVFQ